MQSRPAAHSLPPLATDSTPELREKSAKAIALTIHMMQGTPYVYEGEELAMTNAPFGGLEDSAT